MGNSNWESCHYEALCCWESSRMLLSDGVDLEAPVPGEKCPLWGGLWGLTPEGCLWSCELLSYCKIWESRWESPSWKASMTVPSKTFWIVQVPTKWRNKALYLGEVALYKENSPDLRSVGASSGLKMKSWSSGAMFKAVTDSLDYTHIMEELGFTHYLPLVLILCSNNW